MMAAPAFQQRMASSAISCGVQGREGHLSFGVIEPVRAELIIVFIRSVLLF